MTSTIRSMDTDVSTYAEMEMETSLTKSTASRDIRVLPTASAGSTCIKISGSTVLIALTTMDGNTFSVTESKVTLVTTTDRSDVTTIETDAIEITMADTVIDGVTDRSILSEVIRSAFPWT